LVIQGKITFNVSNSSGQIVASTTINAQATRTTPLPGVQANDPPTRARYMTLTWKLPAAGNYLISIAYDNTATIYRNNAGVTSYPFSIGNIFSILGNDATR
jgi:hypothetical protein